MPAWPSLAPRRFPVWLPLFLWLPQYEIKRILFSFPGDLDLPVSCLKVVKILMGQLAIFFKLAGTEIHRSIHRRIGKPFVNQDGNHLKHAVNLLRGKRMHCRRSHIQARHVFFALLNITGRNLLGRNAFLHRLFDNLIIHIRKIRHKVHLIPLIFQVSAHRVKYDHWPGVSNMNQIVHGRTADIHFHLSLFQRYKCFFLSV